MAKNKFDRLRKLVASRNAQAEVNSDLGFGTKAQANYNPQTRLINPDGKFAVKRVGLRFWERISPFHDLINMSWGKFALLVLSFYLIVNALFAGIYWLLGNGSIEGTNNHHYTMAHFADLFFFSAQTFTTVGYGVMHPVGILANIVSALEGLVGWLSFAVASGLVYGRFAKPTAKILYSSKALVSPYKDITGFMFRVVNGRSNQLIEVEINVIFSFVEVSDDAKTERRFLALPLERTKVAFFSANWTVVHPIDANSPIAGLSLQDLKEIDAEFLVMIKAYDDTFAQTIHSRRSYKAEDILWGRKFVPMYGYNEKGFQELWIHKLSESEAVALPEVSVKSLTI